MHCPTCSAAVSAEMRVCPTCNTRLDTVPAADAKTPRKRRSKTTVLAEKRVLLEAMLDDFLRSNGITDVAECIDEHGARHIGFGSTDLIAAPIVTDDDVLLHAMAAVMDLPSDKELTVPLMRQLLELNLDFTAGQRLAVTETQVVCVGIRSAEDLQPSELAAMLFGILQTADSLDDQLMSVYGGTSKQRSA